MHVFSVLRLCSPQTCQRTPASHILAVSLWGSPQLLASHFAGEDARRLVGVQIPAGAVNQILSELQPETAHHDSHRSAPQVINLAD